MEMVVTARVFVNLYSKRLLDRMRVKELGDGLGDGDGDGVFVIL